MGGKRGSLTVETNNAGKVCGGRADDEVQYCMGKRPWQQLSWGKSDPESALARAESGELLRSGCHVATGLGKSLTKYYKFVASNVG